MEAALQALARFIAVVLDFLAVLTVLVGALETAVHAAHLAARGSSTNSERRDVWLHFATWLGAALTFQLGADIVQTTVTPTWDDIGRIAAIAGIRTFLVYFLERDIGTIGDRQRASVHRQAGA